MPVAVYNKFNQFAADLANKVHNLAADTFKLMLTNTPPLATNATYTDVNTGEVVNGNGYTTGGTAVVVLSSVQVGGLEKWIIQAAAPTWLAAGGPIGPFRYLILYNTIPITKPLVAWFDYGSSITLALGQPFTATPDPVNGILLLS